jgi:hypothetical protein
VKYMLRDGHWYVLDDNHRFRDMTPWCGLFLRAECMCGWRTRPHFTANGTANALLWHEAQNGQRVE